MAVGRQWAWHWAGSGHGTGPALGPAWHWAGAGAAHVVDDRANLRLEAHFEHPIGLVEHQVPTHEKNRYSQAPRGYRSAQHATSDTTHAFANIISTQRAAQHHRIAAIGRVVAPLSDGVCSTEGNVGLLMKRKLLLKGKFPLAGSLEPMPFRSCGHAGGLSRRGGMPPIARRATPCNAAPRGATYWHPREYVRDAAELRALHLDEVDQPAGRGDHNLRTWRSAALHAAHGWWTRASEPSEETI
jgi:hypothetical protein